MVLARYAYFLQWYWSHKLIRYYQPEYRLFALIIPFLAILISTVIYGMTAQNPHAWSWAGIAVTLNFEYFGFVGIVVSSFVYCMDAYVPL